MKENEIRERLKKGWLRAVVTFEIVGKPQQHIEKSLTTYLDNIRKDERIVMLEEDREEAIEHEDGMFSTFAECEILVENLETFTWLCINFSPASIEILEPDSIHVESRDIANWLNDLLAKVHDIAVDYRSQKGAQEHLIVAMNQLIRNSILISLEKGPLSAEEIAKKTGIVHDQLETFLEHMLKKGRLAELDGTYRLA